jgi:hypothetical protein
MAFTESTADFINDDTPGYVLASVGGVPVGGLFDDAYLDQLGISGSQPALVCASADVSTAAFGTAVVVNSVSYTVGSKQVSPQDLGQGFSRLLLQEA